MPLWRNRLLIHVLFSQIIDTNLNKKNIVVNVIEDSI